MISWLRPVACHLLKSTIDGRACRRFWAAANIAASQTEPSLHSPSREQREDAVVAALDARRRAPCPARSAARGRASRWPPRCRAGQSGAGGCSAKSAAVLAVGVEHLLGKKPRIASTWKSAAAPWPLLRMKRSRRGIARLRGSMRSTCEVGGHQDVDARQARPEMRRLRPVRVLDDAAAQRARASASSTRRCRALGRVARPDAHGLCT